MKENKINSNFLSLITFLIFIFLFCRCSIYSDSFRDVEKFIVSNQMDRAIHSHESIQYSNRNRVLYLLNKAMLLRMSRDFKNSNAAFEEAKTLIEELSAFSITEQTGTFLINDTTRSYTGEPFEQVLIHIYSALNYIELGDFDSARVEALQVDLRLKQLNANDDNIIYGEDAFARYLTGIIYEDMNELSDAMIAYREAYKGYKRYESHFDTAVPDSLKQDMLRLSHTLDFHEEHERYKEEFMTHAFVQQDEFRKMAELVIFLDNGLSPIKREKTQILPYLPTGQLFRISLPYYEKRVNPMKQASISINSMFFNMELVENINEIAVKTLDIHMPVITARMLARVALKASGAHQIAKEDVLAGVFVNIAGILTERADTRSWLTLPGEIYMLKKAFPPGKYTIEMLLYNENNQLLSSKLYKNIQLSAGRKTYLSNYWISEISGGKEN